MWKYLLIVAPVSTIALDLTPTAGTRELEGVVLPVVHFEDSRGKVRWSPPPAWRMTYENGVLTLTPKGDPTATFRLRVVKPAPGDRELFSKVETMQAYCTKFIQDVPKAIKYEGTTEGPFTIGPLSAREFRFTLGEGEGRQSASFCFVDLNERERLVAITVASEASFAEVRNEAIQSMFSWQAE